MKETEKKNFLLLRTLYDPKAGTAERAAVHKAIAEMTPTEQVEFNDYQHTVGEAFIQLQEDLDKGLEELADSFPDESDPRKWKEADWLQFDLAIFCHKYEQLYRTYARQEPNLHLVWAEIEAKL